MRNRDRLICAILLAAACLIWTHAGMAQSQAQAPVKAEDQLCGPASEVGSKADPRERILIGRFVQFGQVDRNLEYAFAGALIAGLLSRSDNSIFVWVTSPEQLRKKKLSDQIDSIFAAGAPEEKQRKDLAAMLTPHGCQYLLGGRISRDGDAFGVTLYRLDVETGDVERSLPAAARDVESLMRTADRFATEFRSFLRQKRRAADRIGAVEVGCLSVTLPASVVPRAEAERLASVMRQRLTQGLTEEKRFEVQPLSDKNVCTGTAAENISADVTLALSADVRRVREMIEVRPLVRVSEGVGDSKAAIELPALARPSTEIIALPSDFADAVRIFLFATIRKDGTLLPEFRNPPQKAPEISWEAFKGDLLQQKFEQVALAAYRLLAANPNNATAAYMLGRVLLSKQRPQPALDYFLRAKQSARGDDWTVERLAELNEAAGNAQQMLRRPPDAEKYLVEAKSLYIQAGKMTESARVGRTLAFSYFLSDKKDKAFDELRKQPNLDSDIDTLRLLGLFSIFSEQFGSATNWYQKALAVDPTDPTSKTGLADAYQAAGRKEFASNRYREARDNYDRAIELRNDSITIYLASLAAYELADYNDVASRLETIVDRTGEKLEPRFVEGVWLTLFETYLLSGRREQMDKRSDAAALALGPDALLLASYFRFCAQAIGDQSKSADDLEKGQLYQSIVGAPALVTASKVPTWNNDNVAAFLKKADLAADRRDLVNKATDRVWAPKLQ
jgi:tetratricopeptide (TPR) repeat protein